MPKVRKLIRLPEILDEDQVIDALKIEDSVPKATGSQTGVEPSREVFWERYHKQYYWVTQQVSNWYAYRQPSGNIDSFQGIYRNYVHCAKRAQDEPTKLCHGGGGHWAFKGYEYEVKGPYTEDEIKLLILEDFDRERRLFEKLKSKFDSADESEPLYVRSRIPEGVRIEVWRRDSGKCAICGSREKLEYDHIVPISKGGSNTARNIELLCEKHNRSKSNNPA